MVLGIFKKKKPDPYLSQLVQTDRFDLVSGTRKQAVKITMPWASDPEMLHSLMYERSGYSNLYWYLRTARINGRNTFFHPIVVRESQEIIGAHRIALSRSGTVVLTIGITDRAWWGKGVFEEVRTSLLDHFSCSPRVVRFYGRVLSRNFSSVYNYKKLGFRLIGYETKVWKSPLTQELNDTMLFEHMADAWRAKRGLELK